MSNEEKTPKNYNITPEKQITIIKNNSKNPITSLKKIFTYSIVCFISLHIFNYISFLPTSGISTDETSIWIIVYSVLTSLLLSTLEHWWLAPRSIGASEQNFTKKTLEFSILFFILFIFPAFLLILLAFATNSSEIFYDIDLYVLAFHLNSIGAAAACVALFGTPFILEKSISNNVANQTSSIHDWLFYTKQTRFPEPSESGEPTIPVSVFEQCLQEMPEGRTAVILELKKRANRLSNLNALILVFVVIVLIVAALFIVFAGELTSKDTSSLSTLQNLRNSKLDLEKNLLTLEEQIESRRVTLFQLDSDLQSSSTESESRASLNIRHERARVEASIATIKSRKERIENDLISLRETIKSVEIQTLSLGQENTDPVVAANLLIAAGITRFGVLAIAIYLVQILINLYRYNVRVEGFYLSQVDALLLLDHSPSKIGNLIEKMRPDFEFGRAPSSVPEKLLEQINKAYTDALSHFQKQREKESKEKKQTG